jgi:hypothetical protein
LSNNLSSKASMKTPWGFFPITHQKLFSRLRDCQDIRLTLNKMIQQKNYGLALTENNPLDVWDEDCDGAVLP